MAEGKADYDSMCDDGDDLDLCGVFLSVIEQHEKFAKILRKITQ